MLRVGVIGAGAWGKNHVRTFNNLDRARLVAVADGSAKVRAGVTQGYPGVAVHEDGQALIDSAEIDALVIATPAPTHAALAKAALAAGKHVLVEKPLALTRADAQAVVAAAEESGKVLMVGHLLLYHQAVLYLKSLVDSGELGKPLYVYCERVNLGVIRQEENALWSLGPHDLSVADFLLGDRAVDVTARGADFLQDGIHDVVFANVRYASGAVANIHVSWLDPHKSRRVVLVGDKKMAVFDDMAGQEKVKIYDKGAQRVPAAVGYGEHLTVRSGDILIPKIPMSEPLKDEVNHFVDCILEGKTPRTDGQNGLDVVEMLAAAQRSLESGGVPVPTRDEEVTV